MRDLGSQKTLIRGMKKFYIFDGKKNKLQAIDIESPYNVLCMARYLMEFRLSKEGDIILYFIEYHHTKSKSQLMKYIIT